MARKCSFIVFCAILLPLYAWGSDPVHAWSTGFGDLEGQEAYSVAADGSGNVLVTGRFAGTVDFGGGPLASGGSFDIFLVKLDPDGNHVWSRSFGDTFAQKGVSVATDGSGNVIITGQFEGVVDFGGGPLASAGGQDLFLAKFGPDGNHLWSQSFGDVRAQDAGCVAIAEQDRILLTGSFDGTIDFGGGPLTSSGSFDIFVAKFDPDGAHLWSQRFGDQGLQSAFGIAADTGGNVVVTGEFGGTLDFGGDPLSSAGSFDIFVAKFDPDGAHLWSQRFGDSSSQNAYSVATDMQDRIAIVGSFMGTVDFGGGLLASAGMSDIFIASFDAGGGHLWSRGIGNSTAQAATCVALRGPGDLLVTGLFWGSLDFGGGNLESAGSSDIFAAEFDPNGEHVWSRSFGDSDYQLALGIAVDPAGDLLLTGEFEGEIDFGGGALASEGLSDIFVAKFGFAPSAVAEIPGSHVSPVRVGPNPFRAGCSMLYSVSTAGPVTLRVYDIRGRLLRTLVRNEPRSVGEHAVTWDGRTEDGSWAAPGVCFLRFESDGQVEAGKLTLLR